nr:MAG TPA: hypothetical protein [Caudoviricetes sp.]
MSHAPLRTIKNPLNCCLADFMVNRERSRQNFIVYADYVSVFISREVA